MKKMILMIICLSSLLLADTIFMNDGTVLEGHVLLEKENGVKVQFANGTKIIPYDTIERIRYHSSGYDNIPLYMQPLQTKAVTPPASKRPPVKPVAKTVQTEAIQPTTYQPPIKGAQKRTIYAPPANAYDEQRYGSPVPKQTKPRIVNTVAQPVPSDVIFADEDPYPEAQNYVVAPREAAAQAKSSQKTKPLESTAVKTRIVGQPDLNDRLHLALLTGTIHSTQLIGNIFDIIPMSFGLSYQSLDLNSKVNSGSESVSTGYAVQLWMPSIGLRVPLNSTNRLNWSLGLDLIFLIPQVTATYTDTAASDDGASVEASLKAELEDPIKKIANMGYDLSLNADYMLEPGQDVLLSAKTGIRLMQASTSSGTLDGSFVNIAETYTQIGLSLLL